MSTSKRSVKPKAPQGLTGKKKRTAVASVGANVGGMTGPSSFGSEIVEAVGQLYRAVASSTVVKRNLSFTLRLEELILTESEHLSRQAARIHLVTNYEIHNESSIDQRVHLTAAFEASRYMRSRKVEGTLRHWVFNQQQSKYEAAVVFERASDQPITRVHNFVVEIPATKTVHVEWTARYEIDLPYAEVWVSSTPVHGLSVVVHEGLRPQFDISAEFYRPADAGAFHRISETAGNETLFRAIGEGVFLPFQGIYVKIRVADPAALPSVLPPPLQGVRQ